MNTIKFVLLTVVALFVGSLVNGAIVSISGAIIPPPAGADFTTEAGLKASAALMEPKHFILPWLAHALGTLVGAFLVSWWQPTRSLRAVLIIGLAFLVGGIMMVQMIPSPWWFIGADLGLAYLPMALGGRWLAGRIFGGSARN